jgi:hypothetical protein
MRTHGVPDREVSRNDYGALGFEPIPAYWDGAVPGTLYFEKRLRLN